VITISKPFEPSERLSVFRTLCFLFLCLGWFIWAPGASAQQVCDLSAFQSSHLVVNYNGSYNDSYAFTTEGGLSVTHTSSSSVQGTLTLTHAGPGSGTAVGAAAIWIGNFEGTGSVSLVETRTPGIGIYGTLFTGDYDKDLRFGANNVPLTVGGTVGLGSPASLYVNPSTCAGYLFMALGIPFTGTITHCIQTATVGVWDCSTGPYDGTGDFAMETQIPSRRLSLSVQ